MVNQEQRNGTDAVRGGRKVVVTGGTDGMGRALALGRAARGDKVLSVGSNHANGEELLASAEEAGLGDRVGFLAADLSTIAGNQDVIAHITADYDSRHQGLLCQAAALLDRID